MIDSGGTLPEPALLGRDRELAALRGLVDPAPHTGRVLVLLGEAGMGKSVLLDAVTERARAGGLRVLRVSGSRSEADLAFAGLHQLLRPVLPSADGLPARQRAALLGVFGLDPSPAPGDPARGEPAPGDPAPPGRLLVGMAALTLLSDVAGRAPLLLLVDDAQWIDQGSLEVLAFVARRLESEPVAMLVAARGEVPPAAFDGGFPRLVLEALDHASAGRLLDRQPHPPAGPARTRILAQAAGNPLALVELSRAAAGRGNGAGEAADDPAGPVPLTARLCRVFAADFSDLPDQTRSVLLLAAAADGADLSRVLQTGSRTGVAALAPAERVGLVQVSGGQVRFRHPLVASAIYQAVPQERRLAAHAALAEMYHDDPERRTWHRAAACTGPDEAVAAELEASASTVRRRSGYAAAARALQRAAELSPDRSERARRLAEASFVAMYTSQLDWVRDLATEAARLAEDPALRALASLRAVWSQLPGIHHTAVLAAALPIAESVADRAPGLALIALHICAEAAYLAGEGPRRGKVHQLLEAVAVGGPRPGGGSPRPENGAARPEPADQQLGPEETDRLWALAATDPFGSRDQVLADLPRAAAPGAVHDALVWYEIGGAAAFVDETATAVSSFEAGLRLCRDSGALLPTGSILAELGWELIHHGRWSDARMVASEAMALAAEGGIAVNGLIARLTEATALALRGEAAAARAQVAAVLAEIDPRESRLFAVRARWAAGLAAVADGDHDTGYRQFRAMFDPDGAPVHYLASYYGLAELAAAGVRTGRPSETREVVDRAVATLPAPPSLRLRLQLHRCRGLLAEADDAGRHFAAALADPAGEQWPFERAQTQLDHAEWLRRRRRAADARPGLVAALETFRRLGARPWAVRAEAELRATGVSVARAEPDTLGELTPQQQLIVRLAARGLTNREIGEQLFLSSRTVGSHLYRIFPRLGITTRNQLRDLLEQVR